MEYNTQPIGVKGEPSPAPELQPLQQGPPQFNRHGTCPNCETGWDGGDVLSVLMNLSCFAGKKLEEMKQIANANYGYTDHNKVRFTRLVSMELQGKHKDKTFWQCPSCNNVWDKITGKHYSSLKSALGEDDGQNSMS